MGYACVFSMPIICPGCRLEGHDIDKHPKIAEWKDVREIEFQKKGDETILRNVTVNAKTKGFFGGEKIGKDVFHEKIVVHKVLDMTHGGAMKDVEEVMSDDRSIRMQPSGNAEVISDKENRVLVIRPPAKSHDGFLESAPLKPSVLAPLPGPQLPALPEPPRPPEPRKRRK